MNQRPHAFPCVVPVFDMGPLAVFVVEEAVDVIVPVAALFAPGCFEQAAVVIIDL